MIYTGATASFCSYIVTVTAYLLLLLQMFIFSASLISSSRKSGCAMEIRASALCHADKPFKLTLPYSVTT